MKNNDERMIKFCEAILDVYDEFKINGHIEVKKRRRSEKN